MPISQIQMPKHSMYCCCVFVFVTKYNNNYSSPFYMNTQIRIIQCQAFYGTLQPIVFHCIFITPTKASVDVWNVCIHCTVCMYVCMSGSTTYGKKYDLFVWHFWSRCGRVFSRKWGGQLFFEWEMLRFSQIIATANFTPFTQTAFWPLACFGRRVDCLKILASVAAFCGFLIFGDWWHYDS